MCVAIEETPFAAVDVPLRDLALALALVLVPALKLVLVLALKQVLVPAPTLPLSVRRFPLLVCG